MSNVRKVRTFYQKGWLLGSEVVPRLKKNLIKLMKSRGYCSIGDARHETEWATYMNREIHYFWVDCIYLGKRRMRSRKWSQTRKQLREHKGCDLRVEMSNSGMEYR